MNQRELNPGDLVRLRKTSNLMSGWRGTGVVINQIGERVNFEKPGQGRAEAMRHELVRVNRAAARGRN